MDVRLPNLGEGADSGVVVSVLVKEGDRIQEGQTSLELENEKAVAPIPSTVSGTVSKIRVREGDKLSVGQVILSVDSGEAGPSPARKESAPPGVRAKASDSVEPRLAGPGEGGGDSGKGNGGAGENG